MVRRQHAFLVSQRSCGGAAEDFPRNALITGKVEARARPRESRDQRRGEASDERVTLRDHNLFVTGKDGGEEARLSEDGVEGNAYQRFEVSPDGRTLVAFRVEPGEEKPVYRIESSPKEGGRRVRWAKEGRFFTYEKTDRGHQRFWLIRVEPRSGEVRNVIDEQQENTSAPNRHLSGRASGCGGTIPPETGAQLLPHPR